MQETFKDMPSMFSNNYVGHVPKDAVPCHSLAGLGYLRGTLHLHAQSVCSTHRDSNIIYQQSKQMTYKVSHIILFRTLLGNKPLVLQLVAAILSNTFDRSLNFHAIVSL